MTDQKLTVVVLLWIRAGRSAEFEQFEAAASRIMQSYGGVIERRIASAGERDDDQPDEVHIVTFPSQAAFEGYQSDEQLVPIRALRSVAIERTTVWQGTQLASWPTDSGNIRGLVG